MTKAVRLHLIDKAVILRKLRRFNWKSRLKYQKIRIKLRKYTRRVGACLSAWQGSVRVREIVEVEENNIRGRGSRLADTLHVCNSKPSQNGRLQWVTVDRCSGEICGSARIRSEIGWSLTAWMESLLVANPRVAKITQRAARKSLFLAF